MADPYVPKVWKDLYAGGTPIDAASLNRIEQAIADLDTRLSAGASAFSDWVSGKTYPAGSLVAYQGVLMASRQATSDEPISGVAIPGSDVGGSAWSRNNISTFTDAQVNLIEGQGSRGATLITTGVFGAAFPSGDFSYDIFMTGQADDMEIGILEGSVAATSVTGNGMTGITGFYGAILDVYNGRVGSVLNGATGAYTGGQPRADVFEVWKLSFSSTGGNTTMNVVRASTGATVHTVTFATPTWTNGYRLAVGARTGGSSGTFKVRGRPGSFVASPKWRRLALLIDVT